MKAWEQRIVPAGFSAAALLFLVAAFKPAVTGQELNATFLVIGLACLVLGVVLWRRRGVGPPNP